MAKDWAKAFYKSKRWQACRAAYISKVMHTTGGLCEHCGKRAGYIVDHIVELTPENITNPTVALNHENLQHLCVECHNIKTFKKNTRDGLIFNDEGDLIEYTPY